MTCQICTVGMLSWPGMLTPQIVQQRRKLPPVVNDKALFTRAAPYGDRSDQAYHAPSNRIGSYYSPASSNAAAQLFEEFPQVRFLQLLVVMSTHSSSFQWPSNTSMFVLGCPACNMHSLSNSPEVLLCCPCRDSLHIRGV